jgi:C-terminal processing protease CtpA/Prc
VRLTTAKFYSPSGRPISKVGVQPDIVVRETARVNLDDPMATAGGAQVDNILDAGVQAARRQLAAR